MTRRLILSLNRDNDPARVVLDPGRLHGRRGSGRRFQREPGEPGIYQAAIRRSVRFWGALAVAGFLIGAGVYLALPPVYQASTPLLLTVGPEATPGTAILDDQAIAQSRAVAEARPEQSGPGAKRQRQQFRRVIHGHGRHRQGAAHHGQRIVEQRRGKAGKCPGNGVPQVPRGPAGGPAEAGVPRARPAGHPGQAAGRCDPQADQRRCPLSPRQPHSGPKLTTLRAKRGQATSAFAVLAQTVNTDKASIQTETISQANGSQVLDAAAPIPPHSRLKRLLIYAAFGLIAGLTIGPGHRRGPRCHIRPAIPA